MESCALTAKLNAVFENFYFLRWVCVQNEVNITHNASFISKKFGLAGHFMHREIDARKRLNFNALKNRRWSSFLHLTAAKIEVFSFLELALPLNRLSAYDIETVMRRGVSEWL